MRQKRKYLLIHSTIVFFCFLSQISNSQKNEEGFKKYNRHTINPFINAQHEISFNSLYTLDFEPSSSTEGNLSTGQYYGFGLGYNYRWILNDGEPGIQSAGLGVRGEYVPGFYYKFTGAIEFDLLALGFSRNLFVSVFSGFDNIITFNKDFSKKEMFGILYFVKLNISKFEIKWGLQMDNERFMPSQDIDETMNVFKFTYLIYAK